MRDEAVCARAGVGLFLGVTLGALLLLLTDRALSSRPHDEPTGHYRAVAGWPSGGSRAPGYGASAVSAVSTASEGRVYLFQRAKQPVLVFDREGRFLRSWGEGLFSNPHGCRISPAGDLWLTDNKDHRIFRFTKDGKLLAAFGEKGKPGEDDTHFNQPADVAFGPKGDVYIADGYGNARVVRFSKEGKYLGAWGRHGTGPGEFNLVHSVSVDAKGRVYVADRENARIQVFTGEGRYVTEWKDVGNPYGLFLTKDQRLFVSDGKANTLSVYDLSGKLLARWGQTGSGPGQFRLAHLLAVDDRGAVYVAEVDGKRVQKFEPEDRGVGSPYSCELVRLLRHPECSEARAPFSVIPSGASLRAQSKDRSLQANAVLADTDPSTALPPLMLRFGRSAQDDVRASSNVCQ